MKARLAAGNTLNDTGKTVSKAHGEEAGMRGYMRSTGKKLAQRLAALLVVLKMSFFCLSAFAEEGAAVRSP